MYQNNWQLALMAYVKFKLCFKQKIRIIYTLHGFRHKSFIEILCSTSNNWIGIIVFCG